MAIDYLGGEITDVKQPLIHDVQLLSDMEPLSEGYCTSGAVLYNLATIAVLDVSEVCYSEAQLSKELDPEDWLRVIRLPGEKGFLIDASHTEFMQDDSGRFIEPLPIDNEPPSAGATLVEANDVIRNTLQLEATQHILRQQYGYELSKSVLLRLAEKNLGLDEDADDLGESA